MPITSWVNTITLSDLDAFLMEVDMTLQRYGSPTSLRLESLQIIEETLEEVLAMDDDSMVSLEAGLWSGPLRFSLAITGPIGAQFSPVYPLGPQGHVQVKANAKALVLHFA